MTKRYYKQLAALIAREVDEFPYDPSNTLSLLMLARKLCTLFTKNHPQFDRVKFLRACGLHHHKISLLKKEIEEYNDSAY